MHREPDSFQSYDALELIALECAPWLDDADQHRWHQMLVAVAQQERRAVSGAVSRVVAEIPWMVRRAVRARRGQGR